jgi:FHA domain-containing protein
VRFEQVARALAQGFSCLDQLDARVGPLFFDLRAVERGPAWAPLEWPEGALVPALYALDLETDGRAAGRTTLPAEGVVMVGRGARCDIRIAHPSVAKQHARLLLRGGRLYVNNLSDPGRDQAPWGVEMSEGERLHFGRGAVAQLVRLRREDAPLRRFVEAMTFEFRSDPGLYQPGSPDDRLGARPVASFRARVRGPRGVFEDLLEAQHGRPRAVASRPAPGAPAETRLVYGAGRRHALRDDAPGTFWFEYGLAGPPSAEPEGPESPLEAFLRRLPSAVAALQTEADWLAFAAAVPAEAGVVARTYPRAPGDAEGTWPRLELEIRPPIDAFSLAELWALPEAYAVTAGARLARWRLASRKPVAQPSGPPAPSFEPPEFGPYEVDATLDVRPRGKGGYEGEAYGAGRAYDLRRTLGGVQRLSFRRREG